MDKAYDHISSEDKIYATWAQSGAMTANPNSEKPPFAIPLPPPNVTGNLHLGHAAMLAIEDILTRYKAMKGHEVLWLPGTDHAAIATENVVIKHHGKKSREEWPNREAFLDDCRIFANEKHDNIINQMKKMGSWLDWSREAYTFDEKRNYAVNYIFKKLYDDGLIERGHRLINWSVGAQSVLSDDELEWEEVKEPFYYIRCGEFVIGTVRPETKCADSPLVVHPESKYHRIKFGDETLMVIENLWNDKEKFFKTLNFLDPEAEYEVVDTFTGKDLEGTKFEYGTYAAKRSFYVIADEVIDPEKGAGAMTISSSHSADDYDLAKRKGLDETFIQKIDFKGKMTSVAGPCEGLSVEEARKKSGKCMEDMGLLVGVEKDYTHRTPLCYRSGCVVEPMISPQWFVMVNKEFTDKHTGETTTLCKLTADAVKNEDVNIIPKRFEKGYFQWTDNLQDWCISRQIWWGHRIPVWYDENDNIVATGFLTPEQETLNLRQDEDTLDTWFSSALWPFSTLGWPNENTPDFQKFYPTDVLETGWDILTFWVLRMIMFGRYATGKYPFHTVYLHGMVTDEHGKKMSKSKGNGIDPLEMISEYGADPVRLALVIGSTPGQKIPIGRNKIKGYRNFVNKLWNATRFVQMQTEGKEISDTVMPESLADRWILSRLSHVSNEVSDHLEKYDISAAGDKIYHFVWGEFCDWYLEANKVQSNPTILNFVLKEILKLTHPLCPFVTEKLWQELGYKMLIQSEYPELNFKDETAEKSFEMLQNVITQIRSLRADNKLNPKEKLMVSGNIEDTETQKLIEVLAGLNFGQTSKNAAQIIEGNLALNVEIPVDKNRQIKAIEALKKSITALEGRLSNTDYTEKAPPHLVQQTRDELEETKAKLAKLS